MIDGIGDVGAAGLVVVMGYCLVRVLDVLLLLLRNRFSRPNGQSRGNGSARMTFGPLDEDPCKDCRETVRQTNEAVGRLAVAMTEHAEIASETHTILRDFTVAENARREGARDALRRTGEHPIIGG